jgi:thermostable 8-oxoguanine DNA glycosylase
MQSFKIKDRKTANEQQTFCITDKQYEAQVIQKMREHLGIADIELMPLKELRKSMARHGIRAEDNEFSRAIIEEREK